MKIIGSFLNKTTSLYLTVRRRTSSHWNGRDNIEIEVIDLEKDPSEINRIIRTTEKKYIGFTDSNAEYDSNYFNDLIVGFSLNKDVGAVRGHIKDHLGKNLKISKANRRAYSFFDASADCSQTLMLPDGAVFKTDIIKENELFFDEDMKYCNDAAFTLRYNECAGVSVQLNSESYKTGRILDETSDNTPQSNDCRWYTDAAIPLLNALENQEHECSKIAQFGMLYLIIQRFKSNQNAKVKMAFDDPEEATSYLIDTGKVLRSVSDEILFSKSSILKWEEYKKIYLAGLRHPDIKPEFDIRYLPNDAALYLKGGDEINEICRISGIYFNVINIHFKVLDDVKGLELVLKNPRCFPLEEYDIYFMNSAYPEDRFKAEHISALAGLVTFFDRDAARQDAFKVFIPVDESASNQTISMTIQMGDHMIQRKIGFSNIWQNKINTGALSSYWYKDGYVFRVQNGKISIKKADEKDIRSFEKKYINELKLHSKVVRNKKNSKDIKEALSWRDAYWKTFDEYKDRRIWVYYDKAYKAGDNAEYALRYAAKQDDGIEKIFYIDSNCTDFERLKSEGYNVLDPASLEGKITAMHAEVIYMTHIPPYRKLGIPDRMLKYLKDLLDAKVIRLYHGFPITRSSSYAQISNDAAAVAVGSSYERNLYMDEDNCFDEAQIIESGMPRYDDLISESKKQILFAPSWRPSLAGKSKPTGEAMYNEKFKESMYFKFYDEILKDPKVVETAKETGYKLIMFLHPKLSAQTCDFEKSSVVDSLSCTKDIDYVTIMKQSDLMITDFSSVQYDFAYMRKPVLYFHAPELPYWRKTTFDYENIGFGEICRSTSELAEVLCDYMRNDCELKPFYEKRIEDFFIHKDHNAGKRLYEATMKLFS